MSRAGVLALTVLLLLFVPSALVRLEAAGPLEWSVDVNPGVALGDTTYLLNEPDPYSLGVRSELVFPLDTPVVAVSAALEDVRRAAWGWWVRLHVATSLGQPWSHMTDGDWYLYGSYPPIAFSYTESNARIRRLIAGIQGGLILGKWDWLALAATLLYRFQYIDQNITGYKGWYYEYDSSNDEYVLWVTSATDPALYYRIMYHLPGVGVSLRVDLPRLELEAMAAYTLFYVSDYDDHLLRYKLSTAEGIGHGLIAGVSGRYLLAGTGAVRVYAGASADLTLLRADTKQTQRFYDGPDVGLVFSGLSHRITSTQLALALRVGVAF